MRVLCTVNSTSSRQWMNVYLSHYNEEHKCQKNFFSSYLIPCSVFCISVYFVSKVQLLLLPFCPLESQQVIILGHSATAWLCLCVASQITGTLMRNEACSLFYFFLFVCFPIFFSEKTCTNTQSESSLNIFFFLSISCFCGKKNFLHSRHFVLKRNQVSTNSTS